MIPSYRELELVVTELERAKAKHPNWPTDIIHAAAIVGEESGELTRACLRYKYEGGLLNNSLTEAIHTAATAIRFIENYLEGNYE